MYSPRIPLPRTLVTEKKSYVAGFIAGLVAVPLPLLVLESGSPVTRILALLSTTVALLPNNKLLKRFALPSRVEFLQGPMQLHNG